MSAFVYMLRCADGSYYVGTTRASLERRVAEHGAGTLGGYTASRRPVELVFHQFLPQVVDAIAAERQLKRWTRAKKEALVRGDFGSLRRLASRAGRRTQPSGTAPSFETRPTDAPQDEATDTPERA